MAADTLRDPLPNANAHWLSLRARPDVADSRRREHHDGGRENAIAPDCAPQLLVPEDCDQHQDEHHHDAAILAKIGTSGGRAVHSTHGLTILRPGAGA